MKMLHKGSLALISMAIAIGSLGTPWSVQGAESPSPIATSDPSCCTLNSDEPDLWLTFVRDADGNAVEAKGVPGDPSWVKICSVANWGGCFWFRPLTRDEVDENFPEAFDPAEIWPQESCDAQGIYSTACWEELNKGLANIEAFNRRREAVLRALYPKTSPKEWDGKPSAAQTLAICAELNIPEPDCRAYNNLPAN
jgi:hypothetical protein